jgi:hypothetical protein
MRVPQFRHHVLVAIINDHLARHGAGSAPTAQKDRRNPAASDESDALRAHVNLLSDWNDGTME